MTPSDLRRHPTDGDAPDRASFVELFFDLVFVLAVTQLSGLLYADLTVGGAAQALFLLLAAWWAWIYTTWMTNWFNPETRPVRVVLLIGMLASMLGAIAIPDAFGDRAWLFVVGYVAIQIGRNVFAVIATDSDDPLHAPLVRILVWSSWVGAIWVVGAIVGHDARIAVWTVALVFDYAGPAVGHWAPRLGRTDPGDWELTPSHFVERVELFLIIALGESIVAAGVTAGDLELTAARLGAVVVAFAITAALWWLYFDFHAERSLETLESAEGDRGRIGRELSYLTIPLVGGIIVAAVANELVIAHPSAELEPRELLPLAGGPLLYLAGSLAYKARVLHLRSVPRVMALVGVAGAALSGTFLPALAAWTLVLAVLTAVVTVEAVQRRRRVALA